MAGSRSGLLRSKINGGMRKNIGGVLTSMLKSATKNSWRKGCASLFGTALLTFCFDFSTDSRITRTFVLRMWTENHPPTGTVPSPANFRYKVFSRLALLGGVHGVGAAHSLIIDH